ncbi:hypothetical protein DMB66_32765 [Actinoplanes sp. ATCC 53533]|uniref:hypothetical protein n=1 Tax=Actinoplanes sp. ATCC 53533 TaxID=1288362 RepID=UPI000F777790|nr:hypothetical protein [Actinoplanes sp. ATCC 53533]RSM56795.1 hypothetical protein DMB66_32765 [Actinoplanes sp. ATCC 53533]
MSGRPDTCHRDNPAADRNADDRYARDLPALRAAVSTMPVSAARLLQNLLGARGSTMAAHGVDLMILLAEAFLRYRDAAAALETAGHAVHAAETLHPVDDRRRLCAQGVAADITLYTGGPAVDAYNEYLHQLTAAGDWAGDALPTVYARAGLAVAVCRDIDRDHGLHLLTHICEWSSDALGRDHAVTEALVAGFTALRVGCSACGSRPHGSRASDHAVPLAPLPGGLLQPDLINPDRGYLAARVHDCPRESR